MAVTGRSTIFQLAPVSTTLSGFSDPWTSPAWWAAVIAEARAVSRLIKSGYESRSVGRTSDSCLPSKNSVTKNGRLKSATTPWVRKRATPSCLSFANLASRRGIHRAVGDTAAA